MSASNPVTTDSRPPAPAPRDFASATHTLSLTLLLAAPLLIALPPRKLDLYTFSLAGAWLVSANHVTVERTGRGIVGNVTRRLRPGDGSPRERAREVRDSWLQHPERRNPPPGIREAEARTETGRPDGESYGIVGMTKKVWLGGEEPGWKERRLREEREALAEGRTYWDLITDQIFEVWNWGKKDEEGYGYGNHAGDVEAEKQRVEDLKKGR
ncbi:hypothetical protein MMC13_007567 [Lambiella insularis]|nr:hypothetical protein [Lambiella insularis]